MDAMAFRRDAVLNVRIPRDLKEALRCAAGDDHGRSVSGMLVRILDEWLAEHGYVSKKVKNRKR